MQSRFVFPGWYGLGSALEQFGRGEPGKTPRSSAPCTASGPSSRPPSTTRSSPSSRPTCRSPSATPCSCPTKPSASASSTPSPRSSPRTEHAILAITGQKALLENEPVLARSVQLRNPYIVPPQLHPGRDDPPPPRPARQDHPRSRRAARRHRAHPSTASPAASRIRLRETVTEFPNFPNSRNFFGVALRDGGSRRWLSAGAVRSTAFQTTRRASRGEPAPRGRQYPPRPSS